MSVKVAIYEDNAKFLEALSILIADIPDFELTGAWLNTRDMIQQLKYNTPDVVLMDIGITPLDGIEATKLIIKSFPQVKILIQTIFDDDDKVFAAICAGASGYLLKSNLPLTLPGSINELMSGGSPMSPTIARKILGLFKNHFHKTDLFENYNLSKRKKKS